MSAGSHCGFRRMTALEPSKPCGRLQRPGTISCGVSQRTPGIWSTDPRERGSVFCPRSMPRTMSPRSDRDRQHIIISAAERFLRRDGHQARASPSDCSHHERIHRRRWLMTERNRRPRTEELGTASLSSSSPVRVTQLRWITALWPSSSRDPRTGLAAWFVPGVIVWQ